MYSFGLVRRRRRRKIAAIFAIIGAIGTGVFAIVAFLGRQVGTFTVNLKSEGVSLTMDRHSTFDNSTSYLNANGFDNFTGAYTYQWFENSTKVTFDQIHNENTDYTIAKAKNENGIRFFKFTFFIKNNGKLNASFDMDIDLTENSKPKNDAYSIDEYLRLMVFEDDNKPTVYARRSLTRNSDEEGAYKEYVSGKPGTDNDFGEAELFLSETKLATVTNSLEPEEYKMYTLLFWLEGNDPECSKIPEGASLRIGATINAYPQDKEAD